VDRARAIASRSEPAPGWRGGQEPGWSIPPGTLLRAEPVSSSSRLAELRWVNICVEGYILMSGRSATLELVELSSVRMPTVVAVRTRSALATAKRLCRPSQSTCAVLRVVVTFFVVIASLGFGVDERVALHS